MKILIYCFIFSIGLVSNVLSDEGDFDLDLIKALDGQVYENILILSGDEHGLMFRHSRGIAKIPFRLLSMNLRMLYEPVADVAAGGAEEAGVEEMTDDGTETEVVELPLPTTLQTSTRFSAPLWWARGAMTQMPRSKMAPWPSHWPRYHPAHALAYPDYRELAVRDFLYTTGLAPRPAGVHPYPLPRRGPYCFR